MWLVHNIISIVSSIIPLEYNDHITNSLQCYLSAFPSICVSFSLLLFLSFFTIIFIRFTSFCLSIKRGTVSSYIIFNYVSNYYLCLLPLSTTFFLSMYIPVSLYMLLQLREDLHNTISDSAKNGVCFKF